MVHYAGQLLVMGAVTRDVGQQSAAALNRDTKHCPGANPPPHRLLAVGQEVDPESLSLKHTLVPAAEAGVGRPKPGSFTVV